MFAISNIGLLSVFTAGIISFLSPCVLPLVPGYISYISGNTLNEHRRSVADRLSSLLLSLCFVFGFSTVFIAFGASATAVSQILLVYRYEATVIGGVVIILFGVFTTGLIRLPWLERDVRYHGNAAAGRPFGAYVLGMAFGFGWTPCIGPILGAILTVSAVSATASTGIALLAIYSMGLGLPFLLSATFTDTLLRRLKYMGRAGRLLQVGAGTVMVIMGIAMMTGYVTVFSFWLLDTFPILARIG